MIRRAFALSTLALLALGAAPVLAEAQLPDLRNRVRDAARDAVQDMRDRVGDAVACRLDDTACVEEARASGEAVVLTDDEGTVITDQDGQPITDPAYAQATREEPGTGRWIDYDYLRGERPVFNTWWNVEDPDDRPAMVPNPSVRIGRIPPEIVWKDGNMQMIELDGQAVLEMTTAGHFQIHLPEALPDDFSLEFSMRSVGGRDVRVYFEPVVGERRFGDDLQRHFLEAGRRVAMSFAYNRGEEQSVITGVPSREEFVTVKFQRDGTGYAIAYANGERAQIPNFRTTEGSNVIEFHSQASSRQPVYIKDIRVDYGVVDPVEVAEVFELERSYTTRSIFFDFNSAKLRPESTPELERVQKMIEDFGQPVVIAGHTDAIGADEYNLALSAERAAAVKAYLVEHGVEPELIETVGRGESEPVGDNGTDEGRQANRRVVIEPAG
ncbi:MAG: OmpA family protein [Gemmatimonadetes bacterium]|nr:OmpA family protein [Gemmatimonadota bacterium]